MTITQKIIKYCAVVLGLVIIINIFSLIISLFSSLTDIYIYNDKEVVTFSEKYTDIRKIEIDASNSSIFIKEGTEFEVKAINMNKNFKSNLKNQTLKIEENKSWFGINNGNRQIIITIPADTVLEELSIDTGAGKFVIDDIEIRELDIDHGAGLLEISDSFVHEADIDGGAGEINVVNTILNNLDLDSGVGKVEIEASITGVSEISCGIGELNITLLGSKEDYSIRTEKGIGSIKINNVNQENGTIYGNGSNKLEIDGGIGSINIDFE